MKYEKTIEKIKAMNYGVYSISSNVLKTKGLFWKTKTECVSKTIAFIEVSASVAILFDKEVNVVGMVHLQNSEMLTLGYNHYVCEERISKLTKDIKKLTKQFDFIGLLDHIMWKADDIKFVGLDRC